MATDYGTDISTFVPQAGDTAAGRIDGLDPQFKVISGPRVVLESAARRLMTAEGALEHDLDYGYDLCGLVGMRVTAVAAARIRERIRQQLLKDPRIFDASTVLTETAAHRWKVTIKLKLASGSFELVLGVDNVKVSILNYNDL